MPANWTPDEISRAVGQLDGWLDTMRGPDGYTGPVSHWWDSCLVYTGAMLDWRYEGIVCGYLNLYRATGENIWLQKARRAADDLTAGQLPDGHFRNSSFEHGPQTGGTPHEAAGDVALLELAGVLRRANDPAWETYFSAAERNLQTQIRGLWRGDGFADQPDNEVRVANKNATLLEALLLYRQVGGRMDVQHFIEAAARVVLSAQVSEAGRAGATIHRGTFGFRLSFGIYTARCVGAICRLLAEAPRPEYRRFVENAVSYLLGLVCEQGSWLGHFPKGPGQDASGQRIAAPVWIAPSGDLLRVLLQARAWVDVPEDRIRALGWGLIRAQTACGGIPTAFGLAARGAVRLPNIQPACPGSFGDFRDVLPVVGWCDKAFRALTLLAASVTPAALTAVEIPCVWRGAPCVYREDSKSITLYAENGQMLYDWRKGTPYPAVFGLWT